MTFRSGFVAIVGRPNTGKSTLTNALVGSKVAITSPHPNTTRNAIRGIVNGSNFQIVLVDTPGIHKARTPLGDRLNAVVGESMESVDVIAMCLPADEKSSTGDQFIVAELEKYPKARKFAFVTKSDVVSKKHLAERLLEVSSLAQWDEIVPLSAKTDEQIDVALKVMASALPEGPAYYPDDVSSDQDREQIICELIREAALADVREELPHSIMVTLDEMSAREDGRPFFDVHATIHVERDSQRAILLGHQGSHLKAIGTRARADIEKLLGAKIFLGLHIKVSKEWQRDAKALERFGFTAG